MVLRTGVISLRHNKICADIYGFSADVWCRIPGIHISGRHFTERDLTPVYKRNLLRDKLTPYLQDGLFATTGPMWVLHDCAP